MLNFGLIALALMEAVSFFAASAALAKEDSYGKKDLADSRISFIIKFPNRLKLSRYILHDSNWQSDEKAGLT